MGLHKRQSLYSGKFTTANEKQISKMQVFTERKLFYTSSLQKGSTALNFLEIHENNLVSFKYTLTKISHQTHQ